MTLRAAMLQRSSFSNFLTSPIAVLLTSLLQLSGMLPLTSQPMYPSDIPALCPLSPLPLPSQRPRPDAVALAKQISTAQKELAALQKRHRGLTPTVPPSVVPPSGSSALKYCHKHGYQKTHAGTACCMVMNNNPTQYTA